MNRTQNAYAKINLTLDVGARRADGYHDIQSIMQTISLHDTLTVTVTPDFPGIRLEIVGEEDAGVPDDETNLVHRAAVRLQKIAAARQRIPGNRSGLHIRLHKRIPSQAGLGGGSSDAAATLLAVDSLLGLSLSEQRLMKIGAALGADVPFFLTSGTAWVSGLGEQVQRLEPLKPSWFLLIVKPPVGVSTAAAYAALDALPDREQGGATDAWINGQMGLGNDFEAVILPAYPPIAAAYALLAQTDKTDKSFTPLLCGSGSALFCRISSREEGIRLAEEVKQAGLGKTWVTETQGEIV